MLEQKIENLQHQGIHRFYVIRDLSSTIGPFWTRDQARQWFKQHYQGYSGLYNHIVLVCDPMTYDIKNDWMSDWDHKL